MINALRRFFPRFFQRVELVRVFNEIRFDVEKKSICACCVKRGRRFPTIEGKPSERYT